MPLIGHDVVLNGGDGVIHLSLPDQRRDIRDEKSKVVRFLLPPRLLFLLDPHLLLPLYTLLSEP